MLAAPLVLALVGCSGNDGAFVKARVIEDLDGAIGGPKGIAQPGDIVLENDKIRIAILSARNSMGPGLYGGSIIDADLQWADPRFSKGNGRDQLAEVFPTGNMNVIQPLEGGEVKIVKDGSDGTAIVRVDGPALPFLSLLDALWAITSAPDFQMSTEYIMKKGQPWVTIRSTATFGEGAEESDNPEDLGYHNEPFPLIQWAVESGLVMGDFYLQGGSVNVFGPGIGFDEDGAVAKVQAEGKNTFLDPFVFEYLAGVGDGVSYGLSAKEGELFVPLFTSSQTAAMGAARDGDGTDDRFADGQSLTYERYFFVGHGDVASIVDGMIRAKGIPAGRVTGNVIEENTGQALTGAHVFAYKKGERYPYSHWETDVHADDNVPDGSFSGRLPVGEYELVVHDNNRPQAVKLPITVQNGGEVVVQLQAPRTGLFSYTITDEFGDLVPAKLTIFRVGADARRNPVLGDSFIGGSPEVVEFSPYGTGELTLAPGTYRAVASRGIEYEIDRSETFTISRSASHHHQFRLDRSVDTQGWVGTDLHVHNRPSHDSGVSLELRVSTMVAEGIEFFASTDHDHITDFAPTIEDMNLEEWVTAAPGNETTTVEVGHFLAFPLQQDYLGESGGAFDWTDMQPIEMIDTLRKSGRDAGFEPFVYVGHPRDGILGYFDQYGFNPYKGTPGLTGPGAPVVETPILSNTNPLLTPTAMTTEFDGIELLNGKRIDFMRTPTQPEQDAFAAGGETDGLDFITRTMREQEDLQDGTYTLAYGVEGQIDDWFTLLNLGHRHTALGNSDTHGTTSVESGCPRNFVISSTDDPAFIDGQEIADAVRNHQVVTSYGPFLTMEIDGNLIGSDVKASGDIDIVIDVQAPSWMNVNRVELYENGTLIQEFVFEQNGVLNERIEYTHSPSKDAWYVAIATGDSDMAPVFTPVEIPHVELQVVVTDALSGVGSIADLIPEAIPIPRTHPVYPYALTNPIWVDVDGGGWKAPGLPTWLVQPQPPADE